MKLLGDGGKLSHRGDERSRGTRMGSIAPIRETQFTPQLHALKRDQLYSFRQYLVASEACTDQRDPKSGGDETLDHSDAG